MPDLRVFINERGHSLAPGSSARGAVAVALPELLPALERGEVQVTDARGLPVELDAPLAAGAILRASRSSRRPATPDGDTGR